MVGARRTITSRDVAREAGVSQATVSRAMRSDPRVTEATRDLVRRTAQRMGYVPDELARSFTSRRTYAVGIVAADIENPFYAHLVQGMQVALTRAGYRMVLMVDRLEAPAAEHELDRLLNQAYDGVIVTTAMRDSQAPNYLADRGLPTVVAIRAVDGARVDTVVSDNVAAGRQAAGHLLELGHRRIAMILGPGEASTSRDREAGVRLALHEAGLELPPELLRIGSYAFESGREHAAALLATSVPPTAVICANDVIAFGALEAARQAGVAVPARLSVVGFDDIPMAAWSCFGLTTVRQATGEIAECAVRRIVERIDADDGVPAPRRDVFATRLVRRATTAAVTV